VRTVPVVPALSRTRAAVRGRLAQRPGSAAYRRMADVVAALTAGPDATTARLADDDAAVRPRLEALLRGGELDRLWLAHAALRGQLPTASDVERSRRTLALHRVETALDEILAAPRSAGPVEIVTDAVLVDVEHTAQTDLATGIQRVARETVRRWRRDQPVVLMGWNKQQTAFRRLAPREAARAVGEVVGVGATSRADGGGGTLVPWGGSYVLPELAVERERTTRLLAMARYSATSTGVVGFDCVPLTSAETTALGMGSAFAGNLAAVREMDCVATISHGAAAEYRGWKQMLGGAGVTGPRIEPVPLPVEASLPQDSTIDAARSRLLIGSMPMVLCVGSHEPRKNHLAVLHAAELTWRAGVRFSLVFVGGNAWNSERFTRELDELRSAGRAVESISALSDEMLWAGYRLARCVVFPSLNEGFGLPVAEALACGTPVITSNFGSMAEIAAAGGALQVDPRSDADLAAALHRLVTDDALHADLASQARARQGRTWDEYARELWSVLVRPSADRTSRPAQMKPPSDEGAS
jgi:glycosyltransferase involved in cell wall biosynthesis